ncbi:CbtA family protein [Aldersonia kunmingensis]|uniref:CbtA family protein n=1 Tax=Aldersonia kunmingensis TaxID=408066 RepID=UPI000835729D|nr:CbtA family protein [Aldersonia kunmingensis]
MPLTDTLPKLLLRGLLAGLIAGLLAGGVAFLLGEPHVDAAIAIEEAGSAAAEHDEGAATTEHHHDGAATAPHSHEATEPEGHSHGDDALVSRTGQKFGLFLATSLAGIALGAIFATVIFYLRRFIPLAGIPLSMVLAGAGWVAIEAVPFFKYPANPPAVGDPDTINDRTLLWLGAVVLGLFAVVAAGYVATHLHSKLVTVRIAAPLVTFLVIVGLGYVLMPSVNEVPDDFPATLLWEFRISSITVQATLWTALGLAFAFLTERSTRTTADSPTPVGAAS